VGDVGNDCLLSVDGTDFRIELGYSKPFWSYKFKKSGLRYEVWLCILTGDICWWSGPYAKCPGVLWADPNTAEMQQRVRSRQETVNERFKNWAILSTPYRHNLLEHQTVFGAIVVLTQLSFAANPLFPVAY